MIDYKETFCHIDHPEYKSPGDDWELVTVYERKDLQQLVMVWKRVTSTIRLA